MNNKYWESRYIELFKNGTGGQMSVDVTPQIQEFHSKIKPFLKGTAKSVIDFGCGTGKNVEFLINHYKPKVFRGYDIVQSAVNFCNNKYGKKFKLFDHDLINYDVLWCSFVLQHLSHMEIEYYLDLFDIAMKYNSRMYFVNAICEGVSTRTMYYRSVEAYVKIFTEFGLKVKVLSEFNINGSKCGLFECR